MTATNSKNRSNQRKDPFFRITPGISYLIIGVIGILIYGRTLWFGFTYFDDDAIILREFQSIANFSQAGHAFTSFILPPYFRPVLTLSFILDAVIGGNAPWIYHLSNCLYHIIAAFLTVYCLRKMEISLIPAFLGGLIMVVHPIAAPAVAWIPGRNDLLLSIFLLLSFSTFITLRKEFSLSIFLLHCFFFFLAMFTKETAVVFPVLAIAWMVLVERGKGMQAGTPALFAGWAGIVLCWFLMRPAPVVAGVQESDYYSFQAFVSNLPLLSEAFGKLFIPAGLSVYPKYSLLTSAAGVVILGVLAYLLFRFRKKISPLTLIALCWMVMYLLPGMWVQTYDSVNRFDYVESRLYGSLVGCVFLIAVFLDKHKNIADRIPGAIPAIVILFLAFLSFQRTPAYSDPVTFWKQCTLDSPRAASAHFSLGVIDMRLNRDPLAASASYRNAIALNPQNYRYHNNLGRAYEMQGRFADAATEYRTAMRINPSDPMPPFNLGNTYFRMKNYSEAERYWKMAYSLDTNFTEAMRRIRSLSSTAGHSTPAGGAPDATEH